MTSKTSMFQRQLALQASEITRKHNIIARTKEYIGFLKNTDEIVSTVKRVNDLRKGIAKTRKEIAKLVELQKFTKRELHEAYDEESQYVSNEHYWKFRPAYGLHDWCPDQYGTRPDRSVVPSALAMYFNTPYGSLEDDYKYNPLFMAEAPPAELGSFVEDTQ